MAKKPPKQPKKPPKNDGGGLSATEIARLTGLSTSRVYCLLSEGRSVFEILLSAQRRQQSAREVPVVLPVVPVDPAVNGNGIPSYAASLAKKEFALSQLREIELAQKRGELLPVRYARIWGTRFLTEAKDTLLRVPGELRDRLASEDDPNVIEEILRSSFENYFNALYRLERLWNPPIEDDAA
jgi:hypothetical protein